METSKYMKLNIMGESDDADITKVAENFSKLDEAAELWSNFGNTGTVLETESDFQIANEFPVPDDENAIFAITVKMPRAFAEGDTITVAGIAYNLYQGTDPALTDAWKAGEVVTINFDKTSRRCWASAGGGAPRPLPAQVSNMAASVPEGDTPSIIFTWTNPVDENFAGMVLIVKEGSAPNGITNGVQVYKGTGTTATYSDGVQWDHTYFGRGFAYNSQDKYQMDATGAIASATPSNIPDQVSNVELVGNKGSATLTWTNPTNLSYSVTKVIQKIDSDPESPTDGTEVYSGTGTETTVSSLQDSINYHFGIFAMSEDGQYKPPVTKTYTPQIWPKYDFTGQHTLLKDNVEQGWWRIKFLSSGVLTWLGEDTDIDAFLVGGGGGGGADGQGGCGGFTKTEKKGKVTKNQTITVICGAGGNGGYGNSVNTTMIGGKGGTSSFGETYTCLGGDGGPYRTGITSYGSYSGGTGGGAGARTTPNNTGYKNGGAGGSDGGNGGSAQYYSDRNDGYITIQGGTGQGSNTREFGDPAGTIYAGGGGGSSWGGYNNTGGFAGSGGEGEGPTAGTGTGMNIGKPGYGGHGYGAGGGGSTTTGGAGCQGLVIIRDSRT